MSCVRGTQKEKTIVIEGEVGGVLKVYAVFFPREGMALLSVSLDAAILFGLSQGLLLSVCQPLLCS